MHQASILGSRLNPAFRANRAVAPTPSAGRSPDEVDAHVGAKLRQRRLLMKLTQDQLAQALGLSFHQVQKYENGANRVSASMMYRAAGILGVEPAFFFEGLELAVGDHLPEDAKAAARWLSSADALPLAQVMGELSEPARAAVLACAYALAAA